MRDIVSAVVVSVLLFASGETVAERIVSEKVWSDPASKPAEVVAANNVLALQFYRDLAKGGEEIAFSPTSLSTALAMLYVGTSGDTQSELSEVLGFPAVELTYLNALKSFYQHLNALSRFDGIELALANSIWPGENTNILELYKSLVGEVFDGSIDSLDYGNEELARSTINEWVAAKTEDKIKELIPPRWLTALTELVLVNTFSFKGDWYYVFDPEQTRPDTFRLSSDEHSLAEFMNLEKKLEYVDKEHFQALRLPYAGRKVSMVVLLPKDNFSLEQLEQSLSVELLSDLSKDWKERNIAVSLPKFKTDYEKDFVNSLKELGVKSIFDSPDFSSIFGGVVTPSVTDILHKAMIEVNEAGTEAVAATAVNMMSRSLGPDIVEFRANRPFVYFLQDELSGAILFMGRLMEPPIVAPALEEDDEATALDASSDVILEEVVEESIEEEVEVYVDAEPLKEADVSVDSGESESIADEAMGKENDEEGDVSSGAGERVRERLQNLRRTGL